VSDDGSGAQIGREAVRAALRAHDGLGPASGFTRAVMDRLGGQPPAVVAWVNGARPSDYGGLAPLVIDHAGAGDPVAVGLIRQAADHVENFIRRLVELGASRVCLMGGLAPILEDWLPPGARGVLARAEGDAMDGAILMVRRTMMGR
jgi:glucosamine kinase